MTARPDLGSLSNSMQLCDVKEAIGTRKGNTFNWDVISNIATGAGTTGLTETATMPTDNFTISVGTCVVTEYGNSIPLTRKLQEMSQLDIKSILRQSLVNDMAKTYDRVIFDKFASGLLVCGASGGGTSITDVEFYTAGTASTANDATGGLTTDHVQRIVDHMKELNIPTFDGQSYVCVSHPSTFQRIRSSLLSTSVYNTTAYAKTLSGEIGSYAGVRFVEQTNINKVTATNAGPGNGWALFTGGEAMIEAISVPEELIEKEITDYRRSMGLAWYSILGYANPFLTKTDQRSIMWWPNATAPTTLDP